MQGFLTVAQVARLAGVTPKTVRQWLDDPKVALTKHKSGNGRVWVAEAEAQQWNDLRSTPVAVTGRPGTGS